MRRIGVYGGAFDPIHNGHLRVAEDVLAFFALDRLLLVPATAPPHKDRGALSDSHHRYAMLALATEGVPELVASLIEIERPDLPYSVQTVARLKERYGLGATELYFLMGADSFAELPTWREPTRLVESCHLVVTARPGYQIDLTALPAEWRGRVIDWRGDRRGAEAGAADGYSSPKIFLTDVTVVDVAATEIRRAVRAGRSSAPWVPPRVAAYIEKYGLYRTVDEARD